MRRIVLTIALGWLVAPGLCSAQTRSIGEFVDRNYGVVGGAELTLFTLYGKQGAGGNSNAGNNDDYFPEHEGVPGGRYWFGYETSEGLGIRGRFFHWADEQFYNGANREQSFQTFDIESTLDMSIRSFQIDGFAGMRWGSIELQGSDSDFDSGFGSLDSYQFEGVGLTIGADGRRALLGNISLVLGARYSVLYGENSFTETTAVLDNTYLDILEVRLGAEWARTFCSGSRVFAGIAWEQQIYGTDSYMPHAIDPESLGDVSLSGPVFTIGFDR